MHRLFRHLLFFPWHLRQHFPLSVLNAIEQEISASELRHGGQIRFAVEANFDLTQLLRGLTSPARAQALFAQLRVWDTEQNNGVLLYLLLAEHRVEIVADRGINAKVASAQWQDICQHMQLALRQGDYAAAVGAGIRDIDALLAAHYPGSGVGGNELPNQPVVL